MVWVVSLSTAKLIPRGLSPEIVTSVFGVWFSRVVGKTPKPIQYLYPRCVVAQGYTSIYFGENELSLRLIRLSLLPTSHPLGFQPKWVRSSTQYYPRFNLLMGRSRSFASTTSDHALFRLGFPMASVLRTLTAPLTVTRRIIMQKARRQAFSLRSIALRPLVGTRFQVQCPPLAGVLPIFRSLY
jgi:hypothetical protein